MVRIAREQLDAKPGVEERTLESLVLVLSSIKIACPDWWSERVNRSRVYLQRLWVGLLFFSGCLWWAKRQLRRSGAVIVMTFHRVLADSEFGRYHRVPGIVMREDTFKSLAEYVSNHYEAVDLKKVAPGSPSGKLRLAFTFDDGWSDNYAIVLPIARLHEIPLTIFVCPGLTGCRVPFWPERVINALTASRPSVQRREIEAAIESLKHCSPEERERLIVKLSNGTGAGQIQEESFAGESALSWTEIAEMDRSGVRFGSHTHTHQILTAVPPVTIRREIRESKNAIEGLLNSRCDLFAYPNGDWSSDAKHILAEEGFKLAFTTQRGAWMPTSDPLAIPRANVYEGNLVGPRGGFSPAMFEYTTFWKVWRAMRHAPAACVDRRSTAATVAQCEETVL
jgi:peptidoglycan/xylan/chitin deacetylase (PgdA/CDA1 family)